MSAIQSDSILSLAPPITRYQDLQLPNGFRIPGRQPPIKSLEPPKLPPKIKDWPRLVHPGQPIMSYIGFNPMRGFMPLYMAPCRGFFGPGAFQTGKISYQAN